MIFEFISHATMVGAMIVGVVLVIWQVADNFIDAINTPEFESEDERW